jgi:small-conductance mechanosensitive channel
MEWFRQLLEHDLIYHSFVATIIVVAFILLSSAAKRLLLWIGHKIIAKTETELDDRILDVMVAHVRPLMTVIGFHLAVREVRKGAIPSEHTLNQMLDYGENLLYIIVVLLVLKIVLAIIRVIIGWYLDHISTDGALSLKKTLEPLASKVINIVVGMVAVIIILDHFGINIGSLLVSLGVGSLAVALAAQDTLANMISGFVILVDKPFRVGDRIELASGQVGDVSEIGLRSTKLLNFDTNLIIIPNAEMVKSRIINYAYPHNQMRVLLKFNLAYGTDIPKVKTLLINLASSHPDILPDPKPEAVLTAIPESSLEITLIARTGDFSKKWGAECTLREQAIEAFRKEAIEVPLPQRVVHVRQDV